MDLRMKVGCRMRVFSAVCGWICIVGLIVGVSGGTFTTYVTMEKLFTLEEELISLSDLVLHHEKNLHEQEDVHSIYDISDTVQRTKEIHQQVLADNMTSYISHPINIFHLTKRLVRNWTDVVNKLGESRTCAKYMHVKIQNIEDNLPTEDQLSSVALALVRLQGIYNIPLEQLMEGKLEHQSAVSALSLDDAFDIARAAYAGNDFYHAVMWLKYAMSRFGEEDVKYSKTNALSLLSSSYYMLKRYKEALGALGSILEIDPENVLAKRNHKFMSDRIPKDSEDLAGTPLIKPPFKDRREQITAEFCASTQIQKNKSSKWKHCLLLTSRNAGYFSRPSIQMEIISYKPFIALFHNITNATVQDYVYALGHGKMQDWMYSETYRYPEGLETLEIMDRSSNLSIPLLQEKLHNIPLTDTAQETNFIIQTAGMEGYRWRDNIRAKPYRYRLGTFLVFLSNSTHGGEVVFPYAKVKVTPMSGTVLFWDRKAHPQASICPVRHGAQWVGTYPLYEDYLPDVCSTHALWKPKRSRL